MLKAKITQADYDELHDEIKAHYKQLSDGSWGLDTDGAQNLEKALDGERRNSRRLLSQLTKIVPKLRDAKREEFDDLVDDAAEAIRALTAEGFDMDALRRFVDGGGDPDGNGGDEALAKAKADLRTATEALRALERKHTRLETEHNELATSRTELVARLNRATIEREITQQFEAVGIDDARARKYARLEIEALGPTVTEDGEVVLKDGADKEITVKTFLAGWIESDDAKVLLPARKTAERARVPGGRVVPGSAEMSADQKLAEALK